MNRPLSNWLWGCLALLLGATVWVATVGPFYLYGVTDKVLESIAQGRRLIPTTNPIDLSWLLARLGGDPFLTISIFQGLTTIVGFTLLWVSLRRIWENPVSPTLAVGLLYFGSHTQWLKVQSPEETLTIMLIGAALACMVWGKVPLMCGLAMALGTVSLPYAMVCFFALAYLAYRRQQAYGLPLALTCVLSAGTAILGFMGTATIVPSLAGLDWWVVFPLALMINRELRQARGGFYLALAIGSMLTGTPEIASALALGDLVVVIRKWRHQDEPTDKNSWPRPLGLIFNGACAVLLAVAILPGEQYTNRQLIIPAQRAGIGLTTLAVPFSLAHHATTLDHQPWRTELPFAGLRPSEVALCNQVDSPFRVITPGVLSEDRRLGLVYALLAHQPLTGWDTPHDLSSSSLIIKAVNKNVIVGNEQVLFRDPDAPRLDPGPGPNPALESLKPINFRNLLNIPFRQQTVGPEGGSYTLTTRWSAETLHFVDQPAVVVFASHPELYRLSSDSPQPSEQELSIGRWQLSLKHLDGDEPLPSRSLLRHNFRLTNRGTDPISTREIDSLTLKVGEDSKVFRQPLASDFILYPEENIELPLYISTPAPEGRYDMVAEFQTIDGKRHTIDWEKSSTITTWRRLSPMDQSAP